MRKSLTRRVVVALGALSLAVVVAGPAAAQGDDPVITALIGGGSVAGLPDQFVGGQDYVVGDLVDLYINGVFEGTAIAEPNAEGTASPFFDVSFEAGDEIKLVRQGDGLERVLIAHDVEVLWASSTFDTVTGSAAPRSEVLVLIGLESDEFVRIETVDVFGSFLADFSVPGDQPEEQTTYDLSPGVLVAAAQFDEDGDLTGFWAAASDAVAEPSSRNECMNGGWQSLARSDGSAFRNQGQCVAYFSRGW
jgi:hypothetical protein